MSTNLLSSTINTDNPPSSIFTDIWTLQGYINLIPKGNGLYTEEVFKGEGTEQSSFNNYPIGGGTWGSDSSQGSAGLPIGSDSNYYTQYTKTDLNLDLFINNNQVSSDLYKILSEDLWTNGKLGSYIMQPHYGNVGYPRVQVEDFLGIDLELTKVDSPDPVTVVENLTYTLTVFNNSNNDATEVNLTETLPQGVNFVSSSIAPANNSNNILTFNLGTLTAKATKTVNVIVTPIQVGQIVNTASVGSKEADSDPNDNTIQETTEVDGKLDLELTKVDSPDPVTVGENLTYTLTVFNNSNNDATEVNLTETLPQGVNFVSSSIDPANNSNNILTFNLGTLTAKATKTVNVIVTPIQVGQIVNTASVGSKEADSDPNDNTKQQTTEVKEKSFYKLSSWKYDTNGSGIQTVVDKTIYAEFPAGIIPDPNRVYKGGYIVESRKPISKSKVPNPSEIINEDISNQFLNTNEILKILKVDSTSKIIDERPGIEISLNSDNLSKIGDVSQATLAKLLNYTHFNWIQVVGKEISSNADWYSLNNLNTPVADSGSIKTAKGEGKFFDSLPGGNVIAFDWSSYYGVTNLESVIIAFSEEEEAKGNSVTVEAIDNFKTKVTVKPVSKLKEKSYIFEEKKFGIYTSNTPVNADNYRYYIDLTASDYLDEVSNKEDRGGLTSPYSLLLRDAPSLWPKSGEKTQFTTVLVGVKNETNSKVLGIAGEKIAWFSNYNNGTGGIGFGGLSATESTSVITSLGTGGVEITDADVTLDELSPEEVQFFEENGVDVTPPNVNLSVVRTTNSEAIIIGQDYTYTLKVTNNGSDPATQIVLTEALPSGVDFISATISPSLSSNPVSVVADEDSLITVQLGTLNYGESVLVNITAKSTYAGTLYSATNVTSDEYDTDVTDNFLVSSQVINFVTNKPDELLNTSFYRFQNSDRPGTYLFAGVGESETIRRDYPNFIEEGFAFNVSFAEADNLVRFNRFHNSSVPGTYLYATEGESESIRANYPNFIEEGIAFYAYGADANKGVDYYRFQNTQQPGTYIFVGEEERQSILANFPNFVEEGVAFEVGI